MNHKCKLPDEKKIAKAGIIFRCPDKECKKRYKAIVIENKKNHPRVYMWREMAG